ncbi:hypothetical protein L0Y69_01445 [bacterium]|nr:hypothetical protein [bacterium]
MRKLLRIILGALFPRECAGCGVDGEDFCLPCRVSIPPPADFAFRAEWLISVWSYQDRKARNAVRALKYKGKKPLAKIFAEALHDKLLEELSEKEMFAGEILPPPPSTTPHPFGEPPSKEVDRLAESLPPPLFREESCPPERLFSRAGGGVVKKRGQFLLVPIPLSKERLQKRGFNQSELIAKYLTRLAPEIFENRSDILARIKNTEHQTLLKNREERLKNLKGSFVVKNPDAIRGKIITLIDDVATTGTTLIEARRALLAAGARRVYGATVAH